MADSNDGAAKKRKLNVVDTEEKYAKTINEYQGYSFPTDSNPQVPTVKEPLSSESFFEQFISQRKPCVLEILPKLDNQQPISITRQLLEQVAGEETIQVERRPDTGSNFGQNRSADRQVQFTISQFLHKLLDTPEGELYYWSTQEDTDDPFNVPCRQLLHQQQIPARLDAAGNLILSSCNLWMGRANKTKGGASSGLHHDYHDNFYLLLQGRKRFRLFSPDCAPHLATYGTIDRIHPNGRVSYMGNEARADGVPLASLEEYDEEEEDEEEIVLGKGFDYVSDDDDGDCDFDETKDDFEEIMGADDNGDDGKAETKPAATKSDDNDHPDSFSRINPCQSDQKALEKEFPAFASCQQVFVDLKAGQALYLPAGWFHEVTSHSNDKEDEEEKKTQGKYLEDCHMALNYWYHPPDALDNYDNPYQHDFWKKEEEDRLQQKQPAAKKKEASS